MDHIKSCPRFSEEGVNRQVDERGKREKKGVYKRVLNTCPSFLNEVMASEPFSGERSDTVKMSETPYLTNGSGKNLGKECEY